MRVVLVAAGLVALALLVSCASAGTNYTENAVADVRPGMTEAEPTRMLGIRTHVQ